MLYRQLDNCYIALFQNDLSIKDLKVFQYVKENPGSSQEQVFRGMKGDPSRVTVINILEKLEEYKMIIFEKDKPNSQIYRIYVNNNNLLVAVEQTLSEFEKSFFVLLDQLKNKIDETYIEAREEIEGRDINPILSDLLEIHHAAIHGYILYGLRMKWSQQMQDSESLQRLYYIVFHTIMEIEYRFSEFFRYLHSREINYDVNLDRDRFCDPNIPDPRFHLHGVVEFLPVIPNYDYHRKIYKDWGLMKEARDVLECIPKLIDLWKRES